jgi:hypothetical protein
MTQGGTLLPFTQVIASWNQAFGPNFLSPLVQYLLLKFVLNSIVINDPAVKNVTLNQTAKVETVIGTIAIDVHGDFVRHNTKSIEVDYKGTSAAEASGKFMDSLKNNASAWVPLSETTYPKHMVARIGGGKGKEIGDYGSQMSSFVEGTCLTGDLNAMNRPGLAKRVVVVCKNRTLTSREMTENVCERGDNCFQLFSKPDTTNPNLSLLAMQVLQVAPVPQEEMAEAISNLDSAITAMEQRVRRLRSIVVKGNVSVSIKKETGL